MKILVITREFPPYVLGGISYHLAHLYSSIIEAGHDVTVITGVSSEATSTATDLVHPDTTVHPIQYGSMTVHHLTFPIVLRRFLRSFDFSTYDIAATHTPVPFELPIPTISKQHDCYQEERQYYRAGLGSIKRLADSMLNPTRRAVERRSLQSANHVIFNSDLCRRAWEDHYSFSTPRSVIYNGVDANLFSPHEVSPSEKYVLFVGDSERKGLSRAKQLAQTSEISVYIVGEILNISGDVRTLGRVQPSRLAELYSGAIATIHPAKFEAFGNVVLESLACGTPVVTTSQCGAGELLNKRCGTIDTTLEYGIKQCREMAMEDCRSLAQTQTWAQTAQQTLTKLNSVSN